MSFDIQFKYGTIYRSWIRCPRLDICWALKTGAQNLIFREIFNVAKNINPSAVHNCPYTELVFNNTPFSIETFTAIFPRGDYKFIFNLSDGSEDTWVIITMMATIVSSEIETFG
jgi:hypothetical protein